MCRSSAGTFAAGIDTAARGRDEASFAQRAGWGTRSRVDIVVAAVAAAAVAAAKLWHLGPGVAVIELATRMND